MSGGREWTTGEVSLLHEMRAKRTPTLIIAKRLNRTENAVYNQLRYVRATEDKRAALKPIERMPPPPPRFKKQRQDLWTDDEINRLRAIAAEGASAYEVSAAIGRSPHAVRTMANRIGVGFRRQGGHGSWDKEGRCYETERHRINAIEGSAMLRDAIFRALVNPQTNPNERFSAEQQDTRIAA